MTKSDDRHGVLFKAWPVLVYACLVVVGIPWYWPEDNHLLLLGVPGWVVIAIVVSACASLFTGWLLMRPWACERDDDEVPRADDGNGP